jgi:hypothetical protein
MRKPVAPRIEKLVNEVRDVAPAPYIFNRQIPMAGLKRAVTRDDDLNDGLLSVVRKRLGLSTPSGSFPENS